MSALPDLPSALIRVALKDLAEVESQPDVYRVDMGYWHTGAGTRQREYACVVCFGGAVMAGTLGVPIAAEVLPSQFPNDVRDKLLALDSFRCGEVLTAFRHIGVLDVPLALAGELAKLRKYQQYEITPYEESPSLFRRDMENLATLLEKYGL